MKVARRADGSLPTWSTPTAAGRHETPCPSQGAGRGAGDRSRSSRLIFASREISATATREKSTTSVQHIIAIIPGFRNTASNMGTSNVR